MHHVEPRAVENMKFGIGDMVEKTSGDYCFHGEVRAAFTKKSGVVRYVVENDDGVLHIFNEHNLDFLSPENR